MNEKKSNDESITAEVIGLVRQTAHAVLAETNTPKKRKSAATLAPPRALTPPAGYAIRAPMPKPPK